MKKLILALIFTLMSSLSFADGHSGKIDLAGFFVGDAKAIVDEKGNPMTFVYDGLSRIEWQLVVLHLEIIHHIIV